MNNIPSNKHTKVVKDLYSKNCKTLMKEIEDNVNKCVRGSCIPVVDSFRYMAKPIQYCKVKK